MSYTLAVKMTAKEGEGARLGELIKEHTLATRTEPGNVFFLSHRDLNDPRIYFFYEQFVDKAAHAAHCETEHFKRLADAQMMPILEAFEMAELDSM